jgi:adenine-specific DNA methylase
MGMGTWAVSCGSCGHSWMLAGNWSAYEREAVESRPCPACGAYTLKSPEPEKKATRFAPRRKLAASLGRAERVAG